MTKISLFVCMGSACHQRGVYKLLGILEKLLAEYHLETQVELKGAFCLGPCMKAIVLRVGDQLITDVNTTNIEEKFADEILPLLASVNR